MVYSEHAEKVANVMQATTYSVSGTLLVGDWLSILDDHAAAFGVILGTLTFLTNLVFQWLNHRTIDKK